MVQKVSFQNTKCTWLYKSLRNFVQSLPLINYFKYMYIYKHMSLLLFNICFITSVVISSAFQDPRKIYRQTVGRQSAL